MPAPVVTPHRVGKNAVVSVNGTTVRHSGGTINFGGGVDTQTYPDGYDRQAVTNINASGDLTIIVEYGESVTLARGDYINLSISDGTNTRFNGVALVTGVSDQFANDQGWTYSFQWQSHGVFPAA